VSSQAKADVARQAGADHVIISERQDFESETKQITDGRGVNVVYDSVGKDTFDKSINTLAPLGMMVLYGQSSGAVPAFDTAILNTKGSLFLARPSLTHYVANRRDLEERTRDIFNWIAAEKLNVRIDRKFALRDASQSHELLASRQAIGKIVLMP
jgi:NADPH2:quinone reductase